jgi:hypothetical protein
MPSFQDLCFPPKTRTILSRKPSSTLIGTTFPGSVPIFGTCLRYSKWWNCGLHAWGVQVVKVFEGGGSLGGLEEALRVQYVHLALPSVSY